MTTADPLIALGDQVEAACNASGMPVAGFLVLSFPRQGRLDVEARSMVERHEFHRMLRAYLDAER